LLPASDIVTLGSSPRFLPKRFPTYTIVPGLVLADAQNGALGMPILQFARNRTVEMVHHVHHFSQDRPSPQTSINPPIQPLGAKVQKPGCERKQ
jgi:hypothetical protein